MQDEKDNSKSWKEKLKKIGKWGLVAFIIFEISQIIIGAYIGINVALEMYGLSF